MPGLRYVGSGRHGLSRELLLEGLCQVHEGAVPDRTQVMPIASPTLVSMQMGITGTAAETSGALIGKRL